MRFPRSLAVAVAVAVFAGCTDHTETLTGPVAATQPRPAFDQDGPGIATPAVSLGIWASCALRSEGTVTCWSTEELGPVVPPPGPFTEFAVRVATACAVTATGTMQCWGSNAWLQAAPPPPPAGLTFVHVAMGETSGCGILSNGALSCWGNPLNGVKSAPSGAFTQVAIGNDLACAVRTDGTLACWGNDATGLAIGIPAAPSGAQYTQVALGTLHGCVRFSNGTVQCWGPDAAGEPDVPALPSGVTYTHVAVSENWTKDASKPASSCAVRSDGNVVCWGSPDSNMSVVPPLPSGVTYTDVNIGTLHACAARSDGVVACWGRNLYGEATPPPTFNLFTHTQTIVFTPPVPAEAAPGTTFTLVPNVGSGEPLVIGTNTPSICVVNGTTLSFVGSGVCMFTADRAGNEHYDAAPQVTLSVTVTSAAQVVTFVPALPAEALLGSTLALGATGGASGNPITFASTTPATCSVTGSTLSLTAIGDCVVTANQAGGTGYDPGVAMGTIAVRWAFDGFVGLAAAPSLNKPNAGSAVEVTFSLGGNQGASIIASGAPVGATYDCSATPPAPGTGTPVRGPGNGNPLVYSASTGLYTFTWKTEKSWAKKCYQLSLTLMDGSTHTALFQFR